MINRYPLWKNLLVLTVITLGVIYALPNIYPPDFAVQISNEDADNFVSDRVLRRATRGLDEAGITYFGETIDAGKAVIRFGNEDERLRAVDLIELALHDDAGDNRYIVSLNAAATTPDWLRSIGGEPMKYGLDLRGGVHFLMEVDTEAAINERTEGLEQEIKRTFRAREDRIRYRSFENPETGVLQIGFGDTDTRDRARSKLQDRYPQYLIEGVTGRPELRLQVDEASIREIEDFAISQNIQSIRNRINELGVAEPLVQRLGRNRIVVDLPGVEDPAVAEIILGKVATLEFRMEAMPDASRSTTTEYDYQGFTTRLENDIILRGDRVLDAQVGFDPETGLPVRPPRCGRLLEQLQRLFVVPRHAAVPSSVHEAEPREPGRVARVGRELEAPQRLRLVAHRAADAAEVHVAAHREPERAAQVRGPLEQRQGGGLVARPGVGPAAAPQVQQAPEPGHAVRVLRVRRSLVVLERLGGVLRVRDGRAVEAPPRDAGLPAHAVLEGLLAGVGAVGHVGEMIAIAQSESLRSLQN